IRDQGSCGSCWSYSSASALSTRYALFSMGQLQINLSSYDMVICDGLINPGPPLDPKVASQNNNTVHSSTACNGNQLFNALLYMYSYGLIESDCMNQTAFKARGYKLPTDSTANFPKDLPTCEAVQGIGYDRCLPLNPNQPSPKDQAARYFRALTGYNVTDPSKSDG